MSIIKPPVCLTPLGNFVQGCAVGLPNPDPAEINPGLKLIPALAGKSRNITSNGSFWLILNLFSIHQINMFMPSTAAPKPCPTLVQKAGPNIWTIFRQKWLKKILTLLGGHAYFRAQPKQTDSQITSCLLTVCQFLSRPSMFGHFSLQYKAIRASYFYIASLKFNITVARNLQFAFVSSYFKYLDS